MIAVDTSSFIAFFDGSAGRDVEEVDVGLKQQLIMIPPIVLCELLSDPKIPIQIERFLKQLPTLDIINGFWERSGLLRRKVLVKKKRARLADTLIAQTCIDHDIPLVTRDGDYRHFVSLGLALLYFG